MRIRLPRITRKELTLDIPGIAVYNYKGVLHFDGKDRTVIFEQDEDFGLKSQEVEDYLKMLNVSYIIN